MAVALESLRVSAEMDASAYARGAAIKVAADGQMIEADRRRNASMAQAQAAMEKAIPGFNSLAKNLLQGYTAGQQFEAKIRSVGNAVDQGLGLDKATLLLDSLYRKFGLVADAAVLARQGFVSIVPTINEMNKAVSVYEERVRRADLVTRAFAEAQGLLSRQAANQNQINSQLGVNLAGNDGAARASADAFLQDFGGLDGVAKTKAQQIGKAFTEELNGRLVAGIKSSAAESATAWQSMFDQMDMIAKERADHFAAQVQLGWSEAFNMDGVGRKSAQASAAVFSSAIAEAEKAGAAAGGAFATGMREASQAENQAALDAEKLRAQINPMQAEMYALGKRMAEYRQLLNSGHISAEEFAGAQALAAKRLSDVDMSLRKAGAGGRVMAGEMVNLGYQVNDVITGLLLGQSPFMIIAQQGGQFVQIFQNSKASMADFAKAAISWFGSLFTAGRVAFGGIAAVVLVAVASLVAFQGRQMEVQRQLAGMGRASGATVGGIDALAQQNASLGGFSVNEARNLAAALASTGKIGVDAIGPIVKLGHDFAKTMGIDAKEATDLLARSFADPVQGAEELNKRLGFLDANTRLLIDSLVVQGNRQQAVKVLTDALKTSILESSEITSSWGKIWNATGNAVSDFFDRVGRGSDRLFGGGADLQEKINGLTVELLQLERAKIEGGFWNWLTTDINVADRVKEITAELEKLAKQRTAKQPSADTGDKQRGLEIDAIARATLPAIEQTRKLGDETKALNEAFSNPAIGKWVSLVGDDLVRALQRKSAAEQASKGFDPVKNQIADLEDQIKLIDRHTIADKAAAAAAAERRRQQNDPNAGTQEERDRKVGLAALQAAGGQTALDNVEKQRIGTLGGLATVSEKVRMHMLDVTEAGRNGATVTDTQRATIERLTREQELGVTQMKAQGDATRIQAEAWGLSTGAAAAYVAVQTRLAEARRANQVLSPQDIADINAEGEALKRSTEAAERNNFQKQLTYDKGNISVGSDSLRIAQQLEGIYGKDVPKALASTEAAQLRVLSAQKDLATGFHDVGQAMFSAFLSGKNVMDAMVQSLDNVAKKLADKAFDNLLEGAITGNVAQMGIGAVQAGVSFAISAFTGDQKQKKLDEEARREWEKQAFAYNEFLSVMTGQGKGGDLTQSFQQMSSQLRSLMEAADKAKDAVAFNALAVASIQYQITESQKFLSTFKAVLAGFSDGLGPNSPFLSAVEGVGSALDKVQSYIVDTRTALNILAGSSNNGMTANLASAAAQGQINAQVNEATAAAQKYLVSLLQTAPELSAVQSGLLTINGTATALQGALERLGMSSADAARAINNGVTKAIDALRSTFESGLTSRLNTANGAGYLNDAAALIKQNIQDQADAAALGSDAALVSAVFRAEAQKIVDDAGLIGDAFTDFTTQFPELANVVTQSSDAIAEAAKQQQQALNSSAKSILDYINGLTAGSSSTLSPSDRLSAAQSAYNAKLVLAQSGNADAQGSIATDAENLRSAARDMYGSTTAYQSVLSQITSQLLALPAVQATTDPVLVVMRDVLSAIAAQTLTQATDATLVGTIKAAIDAGNAAATATALSTYFNKIDTNTSQSIDYAEMVSALTPVVTNTNGSIDQAATTAALASMASNASLRAMFMTLDTDNSGAIDRLELIKAASQATQGSNSTIAGLSGSIANSTSATDSRVNQSNAILSSQTSLLAAINNLNDRVIQALNGIGNNEAQIGSWTVSEAVFSNQFLAKIAVNTGAAANASGGGSVWSWLGFQRGGVIPGYQSGGVVGNGIYGVDSVAARYSAGGQIMLAGGEGIITAGMTDQLGGQRGIDNINAGRIPVVPLPVPVRGGNDNSSREVIAELRRGNKELVDRIGRLETRLAGATIESARAIREGIDEGVDLQRDTNKRSRRA